MSASVSAIHHRAAAWSGSASEKRLNQHTTATKQNKNLQRGTAIIEARANQRKLSGAQVLAVEISLSLLYPNHKQSKA